MRRLAVLTPGVLTCSENDWTAEVTRDGFLSNLVDHFEMLGKLSFRIGWSSEMESVLWTQPHQPPWRKDRDWSNQLVPVIYTKLRQLIDYFDEPSDLGPCVTDPDCAPESWCIHWKPTMLLLLHRVCHQDGNTWMVLRHGLPVNPTKIIVSCNCLPCGLVCECNAVLRPTDWVDKDVDWFWPSDKRASSWKSFEAGLEAVFGARYAGDRRLRPRAHPHVASKAFKSDLLKADPSSRTRIVQAVVKRLHMTQEQAMKDKGLSDELVNGKGSERRFRISKAERIHYVEQEGGTLLLLRYYRPGEHDDGLS